MSTGNDKEHQQRMQGQREGHADVGLGTGQRRVGQQRQSGRQRVAVGLQQLSGVEAGPNDDASAKQQPAGVLEAEVGQYEGGQQGNGADRQRQGMEAGFDMHDVAL